MHCIAMPASIKQRWQAGPMPAKAAANPVVISWHPNRERTERRILHVIAWGLLRCNTRARHPGHRVSLFVAYNYYNLYYMFRYLLLLRIFIFLFKIGLSGNRTSGAQCPSRPPCHVVWRRVACLFLGTITTKKEAGAYFLLLPRTRATANSHGGVGCR